MVFDIGTVWSRVQFHLSLRFTFLKPDAQHKPSGGRGNLWSSPKKIQPLRLEQMQSVVFKWILTYNVQTLKLANCMTPTHLLRPLFTIYVEPESQKSERLLTVLGGESLEVMWKAVRWP